MRKFILLIALLIFSTSFSQKKTIDFFTFNKKPISISRIDYSEHGVAHFFVIVTEEDENNRIQLNAIKCLNNEVNLYHTLYFFAKLPKGLTQEEKELFLAELVKNIDAKEKIKDVNYFINLDADFSKKLFEEKSTLDPKKIRLFIDINSSNICRRLSIK